MNDAIVYTQCPLCSDKNIGYKNTFKDEFLSKEKFELWYCQACNFEFTQYAPHQKNIAKYYESTEYVSHTNTQQGIIYKLYNIVRKQMLLTKKKWIKKYASKQSQSLLDVGCGTGHFVKMMSQTGLSVIGIEPSQTAVNIAKQIMPSNQIYRSIHEVQQLYKQFDIISLFHVLEHLHDLHKSFEQLEKLLSPQGLLVLALPNRCSYDAKHYGMQWAGYDMPRHLWHFSYDNVKQLVGQYDMEIVAYQKMIFDSFYVSILSEKQYCKSSFYLLKGFWWGSVSFIGSLIHAKKSSSIVYFIKRKK